MRMTILALGAALITAAGSVGALAQQTPAPTTSPPQQLASLGTAPTAPGLDGETRHSGDRYTAALNFLEASGYTGITNFAADGPNFDATAWHDGHQVSVVANPDTKLIENHG